MVLAKVRHRAAHLISWIRIAYYRLMGVKIGQGCFISRNAFLDSRRGKTIIGNRVMISSGSYVLSHAATGAAAGEVETIIEDNVRIFVNSVIMPGIRIGRNSIVGAGSVVTRDVPSDVVVQGNPARVIQHLAERPKPPTPEQE